MAVCSRGVVWCDAISYVRIHHMSWSRRRRSGVPLIFHASAGSVSDVKSRHDALAGRICEMSTFAVTCHIFDTLQHCNICGILQSYKHDLKLSSLRSQSLSIELPRFLDENELVLIAPRLTLKQHPDVSVHLTRPATRRES